MPVCRVGEPCEEPARGLLLQFRRDGKIKAQARTSRTGRYVVRLRPGRYVVTTPALGPAQRLSPRSARAPRGHFRRVDFHLDTGIQ
jgi:hypothetical protein